MSDSPFFLHLFIILSIPIGYYIIQRLRELSDLKKEIERLQGRADTLEERLSNYILSSCISPALQRKDTPPEEKKETSDTPDAVTSIPRESIAAQREVPNIPKPAFAGEIPLLDSDIPDSAAKDRKTENNLDFPATAPIAPPPLQTPHGISPTSSPSPLSMEYFVGSKILSWVGGFTLFLGLIFFVKYSIENNLVSPVIRVILTYLSGFLLLGAGLFTRKFPAYSVLSHTLLAVGILVLYLGTCAGKLFYDFPLYTMGVTVSILSLTTALALYMAVRLHSHVIAVLGLVGGFLTPYFLMVNETQTVSLFFYISLLNTGLAGIILLRKWAYLTWLGVIGTSVVLLVWFGACDAEKHGLAFLLFTAYVSSLYVTGGIHSEHFLLKERTIYLKAMGAWILLMNLCALLLPSLLNITFRQQNLSGLFYFAIFPVIPLIVTLIICRRFPLASLFFPIASLLNVSACLIFLAKLDTRAQVLNRMFPDIGQIFLIFFLLLGIMQMALSYLIWKKMESAPLRVLFLLLPLVFISALLPAGYHYTDFGESEARQTVCLITLGVFALISMILSLREKTGYLILVSLLAFVPYCFGRPVTASLVATAFFLYPLCLLPQFKNAVIPWFVSSLSPLFLYPVLRHTCLQNYPDTASWLPGLIALLSSLPLALTALWLQKKTTEEFPRRKSALTIYWAFFLGFITLSIGEFLENEWLTIALALEGTALLWLNLKLPAKWLVKTGMAFLATAFIRLILNPNIFAYHPVSDVFLWNWYLYTYGIAFLACQAGIKFLRRDPSPTHPLYSQILNVFSGILLFALINLEIANTFSPPGSRYFSLSFGQSLACNLTYSIAWGLFAMGLLILGLVKRNRIPRIIGLILLGITLLKLFFYDLSALDQMFRIAALVVLSVIILLSSILYQKYIAAERKRESGKETPPPVPPTD